MALRASSVALDDQPWVLGRGAQSDEGEIVQVPSHPCSALAFVGARGAPLPNESASGRNASFFFIAPQLAARSSLALLRLRSPF